MLHKQISGWNLLHFSFGSFCFACGKISENENADTVLDRTSFTSFTQSSRLIRTLEKLHVTPRFGFFGSVFLLLENPRTFDRKLRRDFDGEHLQRSTAALGEDAGCGASPLRPDLPLHWCSAGWPRGHKSMGPWWVHIYVYIYMHYMCICILYVNIYTINMSIIYIYVCVCVYIHIGYRLYAYIITYKYT